MTKRPPRHATRAEPIRECTAILHGRRRVRGDRGRTAAGRPGCNLDPRSQPDRCIGRVATCLRGRRIAIQAKGWSNPVSNSAVQEVVAGMRVYSCNACAVVTNSRFTASAKELAAHNQCKLIDETDFPRFVMGEIRLW